MKLETHSFIQSIPHAKRKKLLSEIELLAFAPEAIIFSEGSASRGIYLILEGKVRFTKEHHNGMHQAVSEAEADHFFGELGTLTQVRQLSFRKEENL